MLVAALMWYQQFKRVGFKFNQYDPCIANRRVNGFTHAVKFHVDDLKSSHINPMVNDHSLKWLNHYYGQHGDVNATRGKIHDYLGMKFIYGEEGVTVDMHEYITTMNKRLPYQAGQQNRTYTRRRQSIPGSRFSNVGQTVGQHFSHICCERFFASKRSARHSHIHCFPLYPR
jgi:hypothetical protein